MSSDENKDSLSVLPFGRPAPKSVALPAVMIPSALAVERGGSDDHVADVVADGLLVAKEQRAAGEASLQRHGELAVEEAQRQYEVQRYSARLRAFREETVTTDDRTFEEQLSWFVVSVVMVGGGAIVGKKVGGSVGMVVGGGAGASFAYLLASWTEQRRGHVQSLEIEPPPMVVPRYSVSLLPPGHG